jgi:uncharacterized membrane protein
METTHHYLLTKILIGIVVVALVAALFYMLRG